MNMRLYKKKGYEETTIRKVTDNNGNNLGLIGTVKDLLDVGLFDYCTVDGNRWASLPVFTDQLGTVVFSNSMTDAIKALDEQ